MFKDEREREEAQTAARMGYYTADAHQQARSERDEAVALLREVFGDEDVVQHEGGPDDIDHGRRPEPGHCLRCRLGAFLEKVGR